MSNPTSASEGSPARDDDSGGGAGPLRGYRVVDLSGGLGAYCTKLLADLGADVIKVEPPGGDPMRGQPPLVGAEGGVARSAIFASYHANKRGVTLDIGRAEAIPMLRALASVCDVVVASPTHRSPVAGFDRDTRSVQWGNPNCIIACVTPFGLDGPLRDYRVTPFISFAIGGGMHWVGELDGIPLAGPGQLAWDEAGIHAAFGIVSALFGRDRYGGQMLDLSVHEVGVTKDYLLERYDRGRLGEWGRSIGVGVPPTGTWMCSDGPFAISAFQQRHWPAFLAMLDNPESLSEPSLEDPLVRREIFDGLQEQIAELLAGRSRIELFEKGQAAGLPCAPVNSPGDFVGDPQPLARQAFASTVARDGAAITIPWRWCHSSSEMVRLTRPAPDLGEHNSEIFVQELGFPDERLRAWKDDGLV